MAMILIVGWVLPSAAQDISEGETDPVSFIQAPWGPQIQAALSSLGGNGLQIGLVSARTVYTREVMVLADLEPLFRTSGRRSRVVLMPAVSIRTLGFERLIGGAAYRGFDVDLGLRAGPGLTFDTDENFAERNRRFELVVEPFVRMTAARTSGWSWLLELGTTRPAMRLGVWIDY